MKKSLKISLILIVIIILVVPMSGCGKKEEGNTKTKDGSTDVINDSESKILSESYKSLLEARDGVVAKIEEPAKSRINGIFKVLDMMAIPLKVCGLDEETAKTSLKDYYENIYYNDIEDIEYITEGNKYIIMFKNEGALGKFIAYYDEKSDSAQVEMYIEDKLISKYEYTKIESGYAEQYYIYEDGEIVMCKTFFTDKDFCIGFDIKEGSSIYKGDANFDNNWVKSGDLWIEYENGVVNYSD